MEPQPKNVYVIRSVWRRLKKGHIIKIGRDLEPRKDIKGGGGFGAASKPITDSRNTTGSC
jgi:hypothetical protein